VLLRGLEKEPDHRWPTASAMVDALEDLGRQRHAAHGADRRGAARARTRRRRGCRALAAAIVGVLAGVAIAALIGGAVAVEGDRPAREHHAPLGRRPRRRHARQSTRRPPRRRRRRPDDDKSALEAQGTRSSTGSYDQADRGPAPRDRQLPAVDDRPCAYALFDSATRCASPATLTSHPILQQRSRTQPARLVQAELEPPARRGRQAGQAGKGPSPEARRLNLKGSDLQSRSTASGVLDCKI